MLPKWHEGHLEHWVDDAGATFVQSGFQAKPAGRDANREAAIWANNPQARPCSSRRLASANALTARHCKLIRCMAYQLLSTRGDADMEYYVSR